MTIRERIESARQRLIDAEEARSDTAVMAKDSYHIVLKNEWAGGNLIPTDEVDARIEAAVAEARALPAALDVVIEAVEAHERSGKWAWKIDDDGKVIWASQFIQLLRALRAADTAPETQDE